MTSPDALIDQLKSLVGSVDEDTRKKLLNATREVSLSLESSGDVIQRIAYLVGVLRLGIILAVIKLGTFPM